MIKTIFAFMFTITYTAYLSAQSFMTNTVSECTVSSSEIESVRRIMNAISCDYGVRICTETASDSYYISPIRPREAVSFTNETFGNVFDYFMRNTTNLTWRYESATDTIYVYPTTNAVSIKRAGPISITNSPVIDHFDQNDVFGLGADKMEAVGMRESEETWMTVEISIDMEEAYVWEILDAIDEQLPERKSWNIWENKSSYGCRYRVHFYGLFYDIDRKYWIERSKSNQ